LYYSGGWQGCSSCFLPPPGTTQRPLEMK
jgi:hypothetical protein